MYCPNCTTEISSSHRYCRSCGVDLREISQALGGSRHIDVLRGRIEETKTERVAANGARRWWLGARLGIVGLLCVLTESWLLPVGVAMVIAAICLMVSSYFVRDRPRKAAQSKTRMKDLPPTLPVPSVTERTTKLFDGRRSEESRTGSRSDV